MTKTNIAFPSKKFMFIKCEYINNDATTYKGISIHKHYISENPTMIINTGNFNLDMNLALNILTKLFPKAHYILTYSVHKFNLLLEDIRNESTDVDCDYPNCSTCDENDSCIMMQNMDENCTKVNNCINCECSKDCEEYQSIINSLGNFDRLEMFKNIKTYNENEE